MCFLQLWRQRKRKEKNEVCSLVGGCFCFVNYLGLFGQLLQRLKINEQRIHNSTAEEFEWWPFLEFHAQEVDSCLCPFKKTQWSWLAKLEISLITQWTKKKKLDMGSLSFYFFFFFNGLGLWGLLNRTFNVYFCFFLLVYRVDEEASIISSSVFLLNR